MDDIKLRRLWLVRHGETVWNREMRYLGQHDAELAEAGREQARWVSKQLHQRHIVAIYASDLQRAHKTAEIIAAAHPHVSDVRTAAAWRELNFGAWQGLTYNEIAASYPDQLAFFTDPEHSAPPQGETFAALVQRVQMEFRKLVQESASLPDGELVLVSHGGPIRALLCSILGMPFARQWQLTLQPGSLHAIDFMVGGQDALATTTLVTLNQCAVQCKG